MKPVQGIGFMEEDAFWLDTRGSQVRGG